MHAYTHTGPIKSRENSLTIRSNNIINIMCAQNVLWRGWQRRHRSHYIHVVPNKWRPSKSKEEILWISNGLKIENNRKMVTVLVEICGKRSHNIACARICEFVHGRSRWNVSSKWLGEKVQKSFVSWCCCFFIIFHCLPLVSCVCVCDSRRHA